MNSASFVNVNNRSLPQIIKTKPLLDSDTSLPIKLWTKKELKVGIQSLPETHPIYAPNPKFDLIATALGHTLKVFRLGCEKPIWFQIRSTSLSLNFVQHTSTTHTKDPGIPCITDLKWRPDGLSIAVLFNDNKVALFHYSSGKLLKGHSFYQKNDLETNSYPEVTVPKTIMCWTEVDIGPTSEVKDEDSLSQSNVNGLFVLKPTSLITEIRKNISFKEFSIESAEFTFQLNNLLLLLSEKPEKHKNKSKKFSLVVLRFESKRIHNYDQIINRIAQINKVLSSTLNFEQTSDSLLQLFQNLEDEVVIFKSLREKFEQKLLENGMESSTTVFLEMMKILLTGSSSDAALQFFLQKIKLRDIKKLASNILNKSNLIFKEINLLQSCVSELIKSVYNLLQSLLVSDPLFSQTEAGEFYKLIYGLMWLYGRLEQFMLLSNNKSNSLILVIGWIIYAYNELDNQNSQAHGGEQDDYNDIPNHFADKLPEISESLCYLFGNDQERLEISQKKKKRKFGKPIAPEIYKHDLNSDEFHFRYFELFMEHRCPIHVNIHDCYCNEDGIPNNFLSTKVTRADIIHSYFEFLNIYNSDSTIPESKISSYLSELSKTMLEAPKVGGLSEMLKSVDFMVQFNNHLSETAFPLINFHSNFLLEQFSESINSEYLVSPPTIPEAVLYLSRSISEMITEFVPSFPSGASDAGAINSFFKLLHIFEFDCPSKFKVDYNSEYQKEKIPMSKIFSEKETFSFSVSFSNSLNYSELITGSESTSNAITRYEIVNSVINTSSLTSNKLDSLQSSKNLIELFIYTSDSLSKSCVDSKNKLHISSYKLLDQLKVAAIFTVEGYSGVYFGIFSSQDSKYTKKRKTNDTLVDGKSGYIIEKKNLSALGVTRLEIGEQSARNFEIGFNGRSQGTVSLFDKLGNLYIYEVLIK
ncbi:hypothetical protein BB560_005648 [Smittium megazygosporum]|uniref:Anaphase-promoting complex subunit 4-like WD40 domain-containing protein n=1 Tax=Smittium megazygosporum TaxID=133381 RepID=A0A2T9Z1X3_9FUNG|nr:hypothetical protein BB560_005648 [Smittium megazygosporum]